MIAENVGIDLNKNQHRHHNIEKRTWSESADALKPLKVKIEKIIKMTNIIESIFLIA